MLKMKVTLAIVFLIAVSAGLGAAPFGQTSQPQSLDSQAPQQYPPQLPGTPPCAQSKNTCELSEPAPQQPATSATKPSAAGQASATPPSETKKTTKSRHHKAKKKTEVSSDATGPRKVVVRQGGTTDSVAVLSPGTTAHGNYSQQSTEDLLSATDANLKAAASRPLNPNQEETVSQIKVFIDQANAAIKAGDLDRGHNLAIKAHLLSDDLVKH